MGKAPTSPSPPGVAGDPEHDRKVFVARIAAFVAAVPPVAMTSTFVRTSLQRFEAPIRVAKLSVQVLAFDPSELAQCVGFLPDLLERKRPAALKAAEAKVEYVRGLDPLQVLAAVLGNT